MKSNFYYIIFSLLSLTIYIDGNAQQDQQTAKSKAFTILENKCNVCHKDKNRNRIFTLENMESNAKKINRQVFLIGRMPKGDEIKLSTSEYEVLKIWINQIINK